MITDDKRARLNGRRELDYRVNRAMAQRCPVLEVEAYASASDLQARSNQITDASRAHRAAHYRVRYVIPTLVGPGEFADETIIHIDGEFSGYPEMPPASWVLTKIPYSPHFRAGTVICIGTIWDAPGSVLMAHVIRHHARLLNWHEVARGGGYVGWNGDAIAYHRSTYGTRPLDPDVQYPEIPQDIAFGLAPDHVATSDRDLFGDFARAGGDPVQVNDLFFAPGREAS